MEAAERSETGLTTVHLGRLRWRLETGETIGSAIEQAVPDIPPRIHSMVASSERLGRLPRIWKYFHPRDRHQGPDTGFIAAYAVMLFVVIWFLLTMWMLFIMPNLEDICLDIGASLPWTTEIL